MLADLVDDELLAGSTKTMLTAGKRTAADR